MRLYIILFFIAFPLCLRASNPVMGLLERIDKGASGKFKIELVNPESKTDFFELDQKGDKVVIRGNNYVSVATGLNWYLKYYLNIHLSWNGMYADLPHRLPEVKAKERHETALTCRYYLNYCTFSYSMAFWDWERWQQEIDWMALHGVTMPLSLTGTEAVWRNVLKRLGYSKEEYDRFIAGPGFLAWWHMNNLEGWGGPNPDSWYDQQVVLQKKIMFRMREFGIEPVLPGYSGMLPNGAGEKLGVNVANPGKWCGYDRPAFLQPTDPAFQRIAGIYYEEMENVFGRAKYYGIDPFHEGGNTQGVDLDKSGKAIMAAMKKANPQAVWMVQAWQANPRPGMINGLEAGDIMVLDLTSESRPQWGDRESQWYRAEGYGKHEWLYCMLLNYGGNIGLFGKMDRLINSFYMAAEHPNGRTMRGVGATMEGIENNPVMYELLFELPWRNKKFTKEEWLSFYVKARYGQDSSPLLEVWRVLGRTAYNYPDSVVQEGTTESLLCARPAEYLPSVSSWGSAWLYYDSPELYKAADLMLGEAEHFRGNNNFEYDLVDVVRQTLANRANSLHKEVVMAYRAGNKESFTQLSSKFLQLILLQDRLLSTRPEFMLGSWLEQAKKIGKGDAEKELYEWNARVQVTTWGNRYAADMGGLRDYTHKEWAGLLKDFYYVRWKLWFDYLTVRMNGGNPDEIDFYAVEEPWTKLKNLYSVKPEGDVIKTAKEVYESMRKL